MASESPSSDIVLSVKPKAHTATKLASTDTGSAKPVITVERHELRNRNTTSTVSTAPSTSALCTLFTELVTRCPLFLITVRVAPCGFTTESSVATLLSTASATAVVLYPLVFLISMPTASLPLYSASVRCSSMPSSAVATSPRRTTRPPFSATTRLMKSCGPSRRPRRRIVRSSSAPFTRPTGTARLPCCSAPTTCGTETPAAKRRCGSRFTVSSRFTDPVTDTSATPGIARSSRVIPGSASNVSCAGDSVFDDRPSVTMGASVGLNLRRIGSSISCGRS